jgi:transcriptional regulator with XRE-family HTH domain
MRNFFLTSRERVGLTQQQVAAAIGVQTATVSAWERGLGTPSSSVIRRLAAVYQITVEDLLTKIEALALRRRARNGSAPATSNPPSSEPRASDPARD